MKAGKVVWICGLSCSGKTTLARNLSLIYKKNSIDHVMLDGDELRDVLRPLADEQDQHSSLKRIGYATSYSRLCKLISDQGFNVIISTISLFAEIHKLNRETINDYFEVYLDASLDILKNRDNKGIYNNSGDKIVVGIDIKTEKPQKSNLILKQDFKITSEESAKIVFKALEFNE